MTTVFSSLLAVVLLAVAVNAASVPSTAANAYYYEPIVPYGPYPAPGYVVSSYLPKYTSYHIVNTVSYPPRQTKYDEDQYEEEEPKYYYGGKFKGVCSVDGLYYKDERSYVVCSNGYAAHQPCPPGTKTDKFPSYKAGYYYGSSDLCSVNLVDFGYGPYSYMPRLLSYENQAPSSYENKPVTSHGYDEPKKDTYPPSDTPKDPHSTTYGHSASSSYDAAPSYPPQSSYQPSQNTYVVDQPHGQYAYSSSSSDSYHPPSDTGSYPPEDSYSSQDSYKPSPPRSPYPPRGTHASSGTDYLYNPSSSYYADSAPPATYKRETGASYSDRDDH